MFWCVSSCWLNKFGEKRRYLVLRVKPKRWPWKWAWSGSETREEQDGKKARKWTIKEKEGTIVGAAELALGVAAPASTSSWCCGTVIGRRNATHEEEKIDFFILSQPGPTPIRLSTLGGYKHILRSPN